jgi:hypothetical protein
VTLQGTKKKAHIADCSPLSLSLYLVILGASVREQELENFDALVVLEEALLEDLYLQFARLNTIVKQINRNTSVCASRRSVSPVRATEHNSNTN